jgi:hypothetical protein
VRWKIASRGPRAHTVENSGVTLGYRDADSLQELRLLLACVPARTPSLLLLLTQPLEVRLDDSLSRVELEANAALVVKGTVAIATNFSGGFIDATGPSYLLCLLVSALDVAANGEGFVYL